jgi:ribosome-binding factor A
MATISTIELRLLYLCVVSSTVRQQKFSRLIQKELSDIFQRDQRGILGNTFITIVDVRVSPDLSVAKVYFSMVLVKDRKAVLEKLDAHKKEIRRALGDRIRNQARIIPQLVFYIDEVEEKAERMDELIKNLKIPPPDTKQES